MRGLVAFEWAEAGRASVPGAGGLAVWVQGGDPALCPTLGAAGPGRGFLALSGCTVHCEIRFKWARPSRIGSAGAISMRSGTSSPALNLGSVSSQGQVVIFNKTPPRPFFSFPPRTQDVSKRYLLGYFTGRVRLRWGRSGAGSHSSRCSQQLECPYFWL